MKANGNNKATGVQDFALRHANYREAERTATVTVHSFTYSFVFLNGKYIPFS
jgi:hypothetical protein